MQVNFKAIGISYKTCPIEIRESISLNEIQAKQLIQLLKMNTDASDILVLSTCNRTEVYFTTDSDIREDVIKTIGIINGATSMAQFSSYFTYYSDNSQAIRHLFDVSMGLDAQVVGDMQISNQVKMAYQWSVDEDVAGPFLHRLMHTIFFTNKRVVQETPFRDGAASVSYAATEIVQELANNYTDPQILVLGLGEIGTDVCKNLKGSKYNNIKITNRTASKAQEIAEECGFEVVPFEDCNQAISDADIIISSISKKEPFITLAFIKTLEILSYKVFLDLSVPRSVEHSVEDIPGALVYNVDSIHAKTSEALNKRLSAIPQVEQIIEQAIDEFKDWSREMVVSPTINKLKNALEEIRKEELSRFLKKASDNEAEMLDKATKSMMQKVMKLPVLQLKAACKRGEADTLIDVLNDLFNLEQESVKADE